MSKLLVCTIRVACSHLLALLGLRAVTVPAFVLVFCAIRLCWVVVGCVNVCFNSGSALTQAASVGAACAYTYIHGVLGLVSFIVSHSRYTVLCCVA
jgi:hypothetical protein